MLLRRLPGNLKRRAQDWHISDEEDIGEVEKIDRTKEQTNESKRRVHPKGSDIPSRKRRRTELNVIRFVGY